MGSRTVIASPPGGSGAPRLQRSWDARAACNFIGGGAGTGLLLAAAAASSAGWPYYPAGIVAMALIGFGLSMVWLEIGRPFRALNVFFHPQTSWMTRESFVALPVLALAGLAVLLDQPFLPLLLSHGLVTIFAWTAAVLGLAFLYCQARILHASQGVPAWSEPALQPVIVATGIAEGLGLLLLLLLGLGVRPPVWVLAASLTALVVRAGALEYYRHRVKLTAPAPAVKVLDRASTWVHVLGHLFPAVLLIAALLLPSSALPAAIAGIAIFVTGAWFKFVVVTRAAFTHGFSLPFIPVRGQPGTAVLHRQ